MIFGMLCLGIVIGLLIGGLSIKAHTVEAENNKILKIIEIVESVIQNNVKTIESFNNTIKSQDALIQSVIKEKKILQKQLNKSTEAIAELEEHLSGISGDDEEDNDDKEDHSLNRIANDKLITIQALLEDSAKKGESVDPKSLLGIVKFKK